MNDNCAGSKNIDSHYVVFAVHIKLGTKYLDMDTFNIQHNDAVWLKPDEILSSPKVHNYTKSYFVPNAINKFIGPN
jgi:hypothetical protein